MTYLTNSNRKYRNTAPKSMLFKEEKKEREQLIQSLGKRIATLVTNGASLKELARLVSQDGRFSLYIVKLAGVKPIRELDLETVIHALLLIGTDRLQEISSDMDTLRQVVRH